MNRIVYLFELDSVRKFDLKDNNTIYETDGVGAMFQEIIKNGNTVAISMNQLADSLFFAQAVCNDFTYPILCKLFECGALRVSLYGNIRTASQYIQNAIQKCLEKNDDSFVFSNLSVSYHEKGLLQTIGNALKYSDLSELQELARKSSGAEGQRYEHICRYINMILNLSTSETGNIPPKTLPSRNFELFLNTVTEILTAHTFSDKLLDQNIKDALREINNRGLQVTEERHNRSNWLYHKDGRQALSPVAAKIINLCYNYTIEDSINGVSKHYSDKDFQTSFAQDLIKRINEEYRKENSAPEIKPLSKGKWRTALRLAEYRQASHTTVTGRYEDNFSSERRKWKLRVLGRTLVSCGWAALYIALFLLTELLIQFAEGFVTLPTDNALVSSVLSIILVGITGSSLNLLLLKFFKKGMPDILESISDIFLRLCDLTCVLTGGKK